MRRVLAGLALFLLGAAPAERSVTVLWFGGTGGISGHAALPRAHLRLYDRIGDGLAAVEPVREGPYVFARDGRLLFRPEGLTIADFRAFLAAGPHERAALDEGRSALVSPFEVLFEHPAAPTAPELDLLAEAVPAADRVAAQLVRYTARDGSAVLALELPGLPADGPLDADPAHWELRWTSVVDVTPTGGQPRRLYEVERPLHEGARRVAALEALRRDTPGPTLLLAGGEDVEDFSFVATGEPDRQRPHTWRAFDRLRLDAIVPGAAELAFGADVLRDEASVAGVAPLAANVVDSPLPGWKLFDFDGVRVLVVGLVDPDLGARARLRGFGERAFTPPAAAVREAVAAATAEAGRRPDAVVAIGHLGPAERAKLAAETADVDLLLADFSDHGVAPEDVRADVSTTRQQALRARAPFPLPVVAAGRSRLGVAELRFRAEGAPESAPGAGPDGAPPAPRGRWRLVGLESRALPVTGEVPPDPAVLRTVQATRQAAYAPAQTVVLPDLGAAILADDELRARFEADPTVRRAVRAGAGRVPGRLTAELWRQLVANVVRESLDAELAAVPPVPYRRPLTGPVTRLDAAANLNVPDDVVVVSLTAAQVRALATSPARADLVISGFDPAAVTVRGRALDDRERYRLATTDAVLADPRLKEVLAGPVADRFARAGAHRWAESPAGEELSLRAVVLQALEGRPEVADDPAPLVARLRPTGLKPGGRWVLDVKSISLEGSSYTTYGERAAYAEVRDTRVVTEPNVQLAAAGDIALRRESPTVTWVDQVRFRFAETRFDHGEKLETADELRLLTELQVDAWALGGPNRAIPFVNVAYDTEFTPTPGNPRRKRLEGSLGTLWRGADTDLVRAARLATVVGHDFAETVPDPQVGFLAAIELRRPLGVLLWGLVAEARYYLPDIGEDTPSELGAIARARMSLDVPVVGGFAVGLFADAYAFRGQVPLTHDPGMSLWTGLALKYDRLWKPGFEW